MNEVDGELHTPLHMAAMKGYQDVVMFLLEQGADRDALDNDGQTALDYAMLMSHDALVPMLEGKSGMSGRLLL